MLEAKLDHLIRRLFGKQSEKLDPAQLELLFGNMPGNPVASTGLNEPEEAASSAVEATRPAKPRGGHRSRIKDLDQLRVETEEIIPDPVAADPEAFERIGGKITKQLESRSHFGAFLDQA